MVRPRSTFGRSIAARQDALHEVVPKPCSLIPPDSACEVKPTWNAAVCERLRRMLVDGRGPQWLHPKRMAFLPPPAIQHPLRELRGWDLQEVEGSRSSDQAYRYRKDREGLRWQGSHRPGLVG